MRDPITIGIVIEREVADVLRAKARQDGCSLAALVRRAVFRQYRGELTAALAIGATGGYANLENDAKS